MCFDLQLMKIFYYSNYSLILWLDYSGMGLSHTYVPLVYISAVRVGLFWRAGNNVSGSLFI